MGERFRPENELTKNESLEERMGRHHIETRHAGLPHEEELVADCMVEEVGVEFLDDRMDDLKLIEGDEVTDDIQKIKSKLEERLDKVLRIRPETITSDSVPKGGEYFLAAEDTMDEIVVLLKDLLYDTEDIEVASDKEGKDVNIGLQAKKGNSKLIFLYTPEAKK